MVLRCVLIPTTTGVGTSRQLNASLKLSRRLHAHIKVLFISPEPHDAFATLPSSAREAGVTIESLRRETRAAATVGKAALEAWCVEKNVETTNGQSRLDAVFATWNEEVGELEAVLALAGRVTDIIIVDRPDRRHPFTERVFDTTVFSTGRPVLVIPEHVPDDLLRHVIIAWNGSLEAAHVVGQSIDLLHEADRVSIIQVDSNHLSQIRLADLGAYLRWHGIVTHTLPIVESGHTSVGEAILAEIEKGQATMLVMGAYTHSRIRQFLLGGVTRHVLDHVTIPVLMAH